LFPFLHHSTLTNPSTPPSKTASTASSSSPPNSPTPPNVKTNATLLFPQKASILAESGEKERCVISGATPRLDEEEEDCSRGRRLREDPERDALGEEWEGGKDGIRKDWTVWRVVE